MVSARNVLMEVSTMKEHKLVKIFAKNVRFTALMDVFAKMGTSTSEENVLDVLIRQSTTPFRKHANVSKDMNLSMENVFQFVLQMSIELIMHVYAKMDSIEFKEDAFSALNIPITI